MKLTYFPFVLIALFASLSVTQAGEYEKMKRVENPVAVSAVKHIGGFFGHRMELNRENYLKKFPIDTYVRFIEKREHTAWDWTRAEQHGKWIESSYLSALQDEDSQLLEQANHILERIIRSQEEDGYVGATAKSYRSPERPLRGMDAYELYFVIHAFLTVYEETGNPQALAAAEKLCNYILRYIGPGKNEFWPSKLRYPENKNQKLSGQSLLAGHAVHYSWEGTLLIDPILRLYAHTGKSEYLQWGEWITHHIDKWSGWNAFSNLDSVASGKMGVHELQPYVHSHTFHMNFMGFLRLYRITGDESLLRKVTGAWDDIQKRQMYITGGVSVAEHYEHGFVKPLSGNIVETCATMSWMQLTQSLLELTGDVKYANAMERLMINHVFAAQTSDGDGLRYHTAPNGTKPSGYFRAPDCCTASGHRIISLLPTFIYAENKDRFYVNQYLESQYTGEDFAFDIHTQYPETESIEMTICPAKPIRKTLCLRIPQWCKSPKATINGKEIKHLRSNEYLKITRKWKQGDRIKLVFPMEIQWVKREHHSQYTYTTLPGGEHMYTESPTDQIPHAFVRGPIVYALDMVWNEHIEDGKADLDKEIRMKTEILPVPLNKPDPHMLGPVYQARAIYRNKETEVLLTPFANAGKWHRNNSGKPQPHEQKYSYAIWVYAAGD